MSKRLYVGNIGNLSESDVKQSFSAYGDIERIDMKQSYCFVEFVNPDHAVEAVKNLDGQDVNGQKLSVQHSKGKPRSAEEFRSDRRRDPRDHRDRDSYRSREGRDRPRGGRSGPSSHSENRIVVENLNSSATWQNLKDHFRHKIGEVVYTNVVNDSGKVKGIVEFKYNEDVERAIRKLDNSEFHGANIYIKEDSRRRRRSRSRSHGRRYSPYKRRSSPYERRKSRSRSPVPRKSDKSPVKQQSKSPSPARREHSKSP